jgi:Asp-tRNA(Asn)/Glu-tRNA(Gln) amidotransferase A subunit family amidase
VFDQVDFVIAATNPGVAFAAEAEHSGREASFIDWAKSSAPALYAFRGLLVGIRLGSVAAPKLPSLLIDNAARRFPELVSMGGLTIVSNIYGNPAISIPAGTLDGLPIGMQVLARHHADALLFDVALAVERTRPWPMTAPHPALADT